MEDGSRLIFRITFGRPWLFVVTLLALLATLGVSVALVAGDFSAAGGVLLALAGVAVVLLLPIAMVARVARWHVDPRGIGGRNNMLIYHRLDWSEIESVDPWLIPGYPYLQVNGGGKRWVFWLPLFVTDMPGLRAAVARYAPPDNPLRRYLEQHVA
jgi:hypothetical protein